MSVQSLEIWSPATWADTRTCCTCKEQCILRGSLWFGRATVGAICGWEMWIGYEVGNIRNWLRIAKFSRPKSVNKKRIGIVSSHEISNPEKGQYWSWELLFWDFTRRRLLSQSPTFQEYFSVPSSRVKQSKDGFTLEDGTDRFYRYFGNWLAICVVVRASYTLKPCIGVVS